MTYAEQLRETLIRRGIIRPRPGADDEPTLALDDNGRARARAHISQGWIAATRHVRQGWIKSARKREEH
jgi:hypothetical protein